MCACMCVWVCVKCYACYLGFGTKEIIVESEKFFESNHSFVKRTELENFPQRTNAKIGQIHVSLNAKIKEYNYTED